MPSRDDIVDLAPDSEDIKLIPLPDVKHAQLLPSKIERCHLTPIKLIFPRFFPSYEIEPGADCDARLPLSKIERAASGVAVTSAAGSTFRQPMILAAAAATGLLAAARLWMPDLSPCRWFPSRR